MKLLFTIILLLLAYGCEFSQLVGAQGTQVIKSEKGSVSVSCEDQACTLAVNGEMNQSKIYHMGDALPIFKRIEGSRDFFLTAVKKPGNRCPV